MSNIKYKYVCSLKFFSINGAADPSYYQTYAKSYLIVNLIFFSLFSQSVTNCGNYVINLH